jgi:chromate transport protein ChrA
MDANTVSMISDIVVGFSALVVAIVAFFGLRTWRKELTGKAKYEIARNIVTLLVLLPKLPEDNEEIMNRERKHNYWTNGIFE